MEKGDFKFAHPSADILGLVKTIHAITDMVRINHGLRPKYDKQLPDSGFALLMDKIGVIQDNIRRARLFREREQQLFQIIKRLWNVHHSKSGERKFSKYARLEVAYKIPEFPVDPKTKKEDLLMEQKILDSEDKHSIKKLYPYYSESEITKLIKKRRKDKEERLQFELDLEINKANKLKEAGIEDAQDQNNTTKEDVPKPKIDNRAKHSEESSKQPGKNNDFRSKDKE